MQGCLEFPSLVELTIYLFDFKSRDHGIWCPKKNVNNCYITMYFIHGMYKNKYTDSINDERRKEKIHPLLFII